MPHEALKRRLTAILSADVEGYSRLMRDDEEATICRLTDYRTAMTALIQQYRGRVVDAPGDNLLAEFGSVVDAVNCAVELQRELAERNVELPENCRMQFRIGVNLGDVVEEGDRIYGDGVNIAARMERLAEAGGICISGTVYDSIVIKLGLGYEYLGEQPVKNIPELIRSYRVLSYPGAAAHRVVKAKMAVQKKWRKATMTVVAVLIAAVGVGGIWYFYIRTTQPSIEAASEDKMAYPLPDRPSIAVLPFVNMSDDPKQEYFSDGITENIITDLSKISGLFVISRSSMFTFKENPVKIKQVAEEFGVRYVLEGSVQKSSEKVRISAQLVDAITGHHLWAERYDRDLKDFFVLQDDLTQKIVRTLRVEVDEAEFERVRRIPTEDLNAYEILLRGWEEHARGGKSSNTQARQMFERAIELDPEYAEAYVSLGWTHLLEWLYRWSEDPQTMERAFELGQKAIELDDSSADAYILLGMVYLWKDKQHEQAIATVEKAIALDPNYDLGYNILAEILGFSGRSGSEQVIGLMEKAMRLNPRFPAGYLFQTGKAYYHLGRYDEAIVTLKKAVTRRPNHMPTHGFLAACYAELGHEEEARAEVAEVYRISPNWSQEVMMGRAPYKDPAVLERQLDSMRKAGLK
jgi:adenylate cyclase